MRKPWRGVASGRGDPYHTDSYRCKPAKTFASDQSPSAVQAGAFFVGAILHAGACGVKLPAFSRRHGFVNYGPESEVPAHLGLMPVLAPSTFSRLPLRLVYSRAGDSRLALGPALSGLLFLLTVQSARPRVEGVTRLFILNRNIKKMLRSSSVLICRSGRHMHPHAPHRP